MIRSVGKTGCSPGGDCCGSCKSHRLGDVSCDETGSCYEVTSSITYGGPVSDPGAALPLPLFNPAVTASRNAATSVIANPPPAGISPTALYIGGAFLLVLLLELTSRRR